MHFHHFAVILALAFAVDGAFVHPGIVNGAGSLNFVKNNIAQKKEPWTSALAKAKTHLYAKKTWEPKPVADIRCTHSNPDVSCFDEVQDAQAAYLQALLWFFTGDKEYAATSIRIMNAWSAVLKKHTFDSTTYVNGKLQAAWGAEIFCKAAELIRYTGAGWAAADIAQFEKMLNTAFLPMVVNGHIGAGANWVLSMADATINIGIFTNNQSAFNEGISDFRKQFPATVYLKKDGAKPLYPPESIWYEGSKAGTIDKYWRYPSSYVDGLQTETGRDGVHMTFGVAAAVMSAETAKIQGIDLYGEYADRFVATMEYNTKYLYDPNASGWLFPNKQTPGSAEFSWEMGYNHFAKRLGKYLPNTEKWILKNRPTGSAIHMNFETLTHGGLIDPGRTVAAVETTPEDTVLNPPIEITENDQSATFGTEGQNIETFWSPDPDYEDTDATVTSTDASKQFQSGSVTLVPVLFIFAIALFF